MAGRVALAPLIRAHHCTGVKPNLRPLPGVDRGTQWMNGGYSGALRLGNLCAA